MRQRHLTDYSVGIIFGIFLFVAMPVFIIAGAHKCANEPSGLGCAIITFVFNDQSPVSQERVAKAR
jgi:hypothetical protein